MVKGVELKDTVVKEKPKTFRVCNVRRRYFYRLITVAVSHPSVTPTRLMSICLVLAYTTLLALASSLARGCSRLLAVCIKVWNVVCLVF